MRSEVSGWCGVLQSSEVPNWIEAIAATAAAIGTIVGVIFAYNRYRDSLKDKKRDQARFVHAYVDRSWILEEGETERGTTLRDHGLNREAPPGAVFRHFVTESRNAGVNEITAQVRVAICRVTVENRSEEIVTSLHGQLSVWETTPTGSRTGKNGPWAVFPYFLPKTEESFFVAVPYDGTLEDIENRIDPIIIFKDANGSTWSRSPHGPPDLWDDV